jgi:hypothetical protein
MNDDPGEQVQPQGRVNQRQDHVDRDHNPGDASRREDAAERSCGCAG